MKKPEEANVTVKELVKRRTFMSKAGLLGMIATAATLLGTSKLKANSWSEDDQDDRDNLSGDTAQQVFTTARIA